MCGVRGTYRCHEETKGSAECEPHHTWDDSLPRTRFHYHLHLLKQGQYLLMQHKASSASMVSHMGEPRKPWYPKDNEHTFLTAAAVEGSTICWPPPGGLKAGPCISKDNNCDILCREKGTCMQTGNPVVVIHRDFFFGEANVWPCTTIATELPSSEPFNLPTLLSQILGYDKKSYDERNEVDSRLVLYLIIEIVNISSYIEDSGRSLLGR